MRASVCFIPLVLAQGGGIIFKAGVPVAEKLVLKYCEKARKCRSTRMHGPM